MIRTKIWRRPWKHWFGKIARGQRHMAKEHVEWLVHAGRIERDEKFLVGKEGWLFLADDSNDSLAQHAGTRRFSPSDLESWKALLEHRASQLGERNISYAVLVAPDTHSVYPEYLPGGIPHAKQRPVTQLTEFLDQTASPARVVYPLEEMVSQKPAGLVCSPIDSHWTEFGAFVAYSALMKELSEHVDARRLSRSDLVFYELIGGGDLGSKLAPMRLEVQPVAILRYPQARLLYDNCIENTGSLCVTECRVAPPTTCLLLGDSYAYSIAKFLSESFGRLVIAHTTRLDWRLIEQFQPDVVLSLTAERFLIEVPDDEGASHAGDEVAKRAARRTRPPLVNWSNFPRWPAPAETEALRAHLLAAGKVRDATMISVLAYGGVLPQELTALRWPDVGEHELTVRRPGKKVGEGSPARRVPLIGPLADDLREWRRLSNPARPRELVFPGEDDLHWAGAEWSAWRRDVFDPAVRACGLELKSPHELRHTFCTLTLYEGLPMKELARRIGAGMGETRRLYGWLADILESAEPIDPATFVWAARGALLVRGSVRESASRLLGAVPIMGRYAIQRGLEPISAGDGDLRRELRHGREAADRAAQDH
jgi:alginate O-acetyltransferase complex protein AlgJ